jgi:hypothetical protein
LERLHLLTKPAREHGALPSEDDYDQMVNLFEQIKDTSDAIVADAEARTVDQPAAPHDESPSTETAVPAAWQGWEPLGKDAVESFQADPAAPKEVAVSDAAAPERSEVSSEAAIPSEQLVSLETQVAQLQTHITALRAEYEKYPRRADGSRDVSHLDAALATALSRLEALEQQLPAQPESSEAETVSTAAYDRYARIVEEVASNVDAIEQAAPANSPAQPETRGNSPEATETEPPTEAEVMALLEPIKENQFYTDDERMTVSALSEMYFRSVAEAQSAEAQRRAFENLRNFVDELDTQTQPEVLGKRIERIMYRLENGARNREPGLLQTAEAIREMYDRAVTEEADGARILQAYDNLERFALDHEHEWLTVCGMHLPEPGPAGVTQARSLREGLMVMRDRHPSLIQHPEKLVKVDRIIRRLRQVPKDGLTAKEVTELAQLTREIDIPQSWALSTESEAPVLEEKSEADVGTPASDTAATGEPLRPRSGPLRVSVAPEELSAEGASIPIRYARETPHETTETSRETVEAPTPVPVTASTLSDASERGVVGATEAADPINTTTPTEPPTVRSWEERRRPESLTNAYASHEQAALVAEENLEREVDRVIRAEVARVERRMERSSWLKSVVNPEHQSVFEMLRDTSLQEVEDIAQSFSAGDREELLNLYGIRYDDLVNWMDEVPEMRAALKEVGETLSPDATFGELVVRSLIAREVQSA